MVLMDKIYFNINFCLNLLFSILRGSWNIIVLIVKEVSSSEINFICKLICKLYIGKFLFSDDFKNLYLKGGKKVI